MILATIIIIIIILAKFTFRPPRRILRSRNPVDWGGGEGDRNRGNRARGLGGKGVTTTRITFARSSPRRICGGRRSRRVVNEAEPIVSLHQ